jgi:hypothetical protein
MIAIVNKRVNTRLDATTASKKLIPREVGESFEVKKLAPGEMLRGNRIWAFDEKGKSNWSGALNLDYGKIITNQSNLYKLFQINKIWNYTTGENVKVCLVDSGIKQTSSLTGSVKKFDDSVVGGSMHGTYMAEIIAAFDFENSYYGIAPNTEIKSIKVDPSNFTSDSLYKILNENRDADIFNFSLNNRNPSFENNVEIGSNLSSILDEFQMNNKILVGATGNQRMKEIGFKFYPASLKSFISVAGTNYLSSSVVQFYSSSNIWEDKHILAPASKCFISNKGEYKEFEEGTSVACAFLSGVLSLIISACKKNGVTTYKAVINNFFDDLPKTEVKVVGGVINCKYVNIDSLHKLISKIQS